MSAMKLTLWRGTVCQFEAVPTPGAKGLFASQTAKATQIPTTIAVIARR